MWIDVFQTGLVVAVVTLTMDFDLPGGLIDGTADLVTARTAGFTVLVMCSMFVCFCSRSDTTSAFSHLVVNRWLWAAVTLSVALQVAVVRVGFLDVAFGTVPLAATRWAFCVAMASGVLWVSEAVKLGLRLRRARDDDAGRARSGP